MKIGSKTNNMPLYSISIAAQLMGISVHTLRMYERESLIIPYKSKTNRRLYSDADVERVKKIRENINECKLNINSLRMMASLIPCWRQKNCSDKDKSNCEAYNEVSKPCWAYQHNENMCGQLECRECKVYKSNTDVLKVFESVVSAFVDGKKHNIYESEFVE